MRTPLFLTVLALGGLPLAGCDKTPTTPEVRSQQSGSGAAPASTPESWLPPGDSASMAAQGAPPVALPPPTGERSVAATASSPQANAGPMPGQNNDHSAPLASEKSASSP